MARSPCARPRKPAEWRQPSNQQQPWESGRVLGRGGREWLHGECRAFLCHCLLSCWSFHFTALLSVRNVNLILEFILQCALVYSMHRYLSLIQMQALSLKQK